MKETVNKPPPPFKTISVDQSTWVRRCLVTLDAGIPTSSSSRRRGWIRHQHHGLSVSRRLPTAFVLPKKAPPALSLTDRQVSADSQQEHTHTHSHTPSHDLKQRHKKVFKINLKNDLTFRRNFLIRMIFRQIGHRRRRFVASL